MKLDVLKLKEIIAQYNGKKGALISILQKIQSIYGYVPSEAIDVIAEELSVSPVKIYGVLTFYKQFYLKPRGRHIIKVCQGTACHVMGGKEILEYLEEKMSIREGQTTADGIFSLERVACLGCCGMAPVVMIDDNFYGRCSVQKIDDLLKRFRQ
ncbi:MAG TPA: NADH-quinone oxidoreductase subunit NuoE [Candidatus Omnitrophica bacterium]|nr:NADH-quinone oxidoreductase subunit NuoE [Candidatus Omnitrophota bacterium]